MKYRDSNAEGCIASLQEDEEKTKMEKSGMRQIEVLTRQNLIDFRRGGKE